jgi:hypothetical protein
MTNNNMSLSDKTIKQQAIQLGDIETLKQYDKIELEQAINKLADQVFEQSPVYQQIKKQIEKGLVKYNTPVKEEHYSVKGWLQHQRDELTDGLVYTTILDMKIAKVVELLEDAIKLKVRNDVDQTIKEALAVLKDGRDQ